MNVAVSIVDLSAPTDEWVSWSSFWRRTVVFGVMRTTQPLLKTLTGQQWRVRRLTCWRLRIKGWGIVVHTPTVDDVWRGRDTPAWSQSDGRRQQSSYDRFVVVCHKAGQSLSTTCIENIDSWEKHSNSLSPDPLFVGQCIKSTTRPSNQPSHQLIHGKNPSQPSSEWEQWLNHDDLILICVYTNPYPTRFDRDTIIYHSCHCRSAVIYDMCIPRYIHMSRDRLMTTIHRSNPADT
jgi:hypothetical protein